MEYTKVFLQALWRPPAKDTSLLLLRRAFELRRGSLQDDSFVHVTDFIPDRGRVTAEQFLDWLFIADGDESYRGPVAMLTRERLRSCLIGHMGSDVVDAHKLRCSRLSVSGRALRDHERRATSKLDQARPDGR